MGIIINGQNDTIGPVDNSMSLLGTVSIGGTMTIEDFTNIDSVGLITARNGLNVTGGNVKIGTTTAGQSEADDLTIATSAHTGMTIRSGATSKGAVYFSDGTSGNNEYRGVLEYNHSDDHFRILTAASESLRITSGGLIGIGAANNTSYDANAQNLLLASDGNTGMTIRSAGSTPFAMIHFADGTNGQAEQRAGRIMYQHVGDNLTLHTANTERLRIDSAGRLLAGTTTEGHTDADDLTLQAASGFTGITLRSATDMGGAVYFSDATSGDSEYDGQIVYYQSTRQLMFATAATPRLRITNSGQILLGTTDAGINSGDNLTIADSGNCGITIRSGTSSQGNIFFSDGTSGNSEYDGYIQYQQDTQSMLFGTGGGTERLRITSTGRMGLGTNDPAALLEVRDSENTTQGNAQIRISKGVGAGAAPATISRANTYLHLGGTEWGSGANGKYLIGLGYTNDEVGTGIPAYMGFAETNVGSYTYGDLIFGTRDNTNGTYNPTERLRITSSGAVNLSSPSNSVAAGLLNVPNGSRLSTTSGVYVTGNGGIVDMARYEMIERCITSFPANNNKICAINGAPLYINDARTAWAHYAALPNYLLGTLTHDCINNTSFTFTLACTMTVFLGRSDGWNNVDLSGWNLIETNTSIGPFSSSTRLYVKTLAAGTHTLDNDSAMYFFSL